MSWKFKKIILQVASWFVQVKDDKFTSCEVAFYKLNIYDANFVNYYHMVESNFKEINFRKLCEKINLVKFNWTLDDLNTISQTLLKPLYRP